MAHRRLHRGNTAPSKSPVKPKPGGGALFGWKRTFRRLSIYVTLQTNTDPHNGTKMLVLYQPVLLGGHVNLQGSKTYTIISLPYHGKT